MNKECNLITPKNIQGELINNEIEQINLRAQAFKEQKYNELLKENKDLQQRIDKTIGDIVTTIQIIGEQPSRNVEEDIYILSKLQSFIKTLGGDVDE